ncbi:MAG: hypothetical protein HY403_11400 [Elusimicrobia bacterium]|nr:hypothetical protein [Elusimicrobiota bacterium]
MKPWMGLAVLVFLSACSKSGTMEPGSAWDVFKGDKKVLVIKNQPGPILSTAILPPGAEPVRHRFITATAEDPFEEHVLGELLGQSRDFAQFVSLLERKGYRLARHEP